MGRGTRTDMPGIASLRVPREALFGYSIGDSMGFTWFWSCTATAPKTVIAGNAPSVGFEHIRLPVTWDGRQRPKRAEQLKEAKSSELLV